MVIFGMPYSLTHIMWEFNMVGIGEGLVGYSIIQREVLMEQQVREWSGNWELPHWKFKVNHIAMTR